MSPAPSVTSSLLSPISSFVSPSPSASSSSPNPAKSLTPLPGAPLAADPSLIPAKYLSEKPDASQSPSLSPSSRRGLTSSVNLRAEAQQAQQQPRNGLGLVRSPPSQLLDAPARAAMSMPNGETAPAQARAVRGGEVKTPEYEVEDNLLHHRNTETIPLLSPSPLRPGLTRSSSATSTSSSRNVLRRIFIDRATTPTQHLLRPTFPPPSLSTYSPLPVAPLSVISRINLFINQTISVALSTVFLAFVVGWAVAAELARGLPKWVWPDRPKHFPWDDDRYWRKEGKKISKDPRDYARQVGMDIEHQTVETQDGYFLKMHRVIDPDARPKSDGRGGFPVLILHGLFQSSGSFVTSEDRSLAFWLAKQGGYQVYLGNTRGVYPQVILYPGKHIEKQEMPIVKFQPFSSLVHPTLWHELTRLKLDVLHLSDASVPLTGSYSTGKTIRDRNTGQDVALGCNLSVGGEGFEGEFGSSLGPGTVATSGTLKNYNTIEEFKNADKHALFNQAADEIWNSIITTRSTSLLTHFLVITFADLKKYKYYYWFAFPAFTAKPAWEVEGEWVGAGEKRALGDAQMSSIHTQLSGTTPTKAFFLIKPSKTKGEVEITPVEEWASFFEGVANEDRTIGFIDPSPHPQNPGWPLRNLLAALRAWYPAATSGGLRVLCWRDGEVPHVGEDGKKEWKSRFGVVHAGASEGAVSETQKPGTVGWERNVQDKMGARMADLAPMMDPKRLADQAVDLNLKLMRWRILPELDLEKIAATRCLLLGAGTLGCYVARTLMGWGIRTITLVDSGRVSFSNPVRQPLFEFEDCVDGGKPKAECAAARLKKIFPGVNATGHTLSIPMPGHPIPPSASSIAQCKADVAKLEKLVDEHDAVFLLMDSRESRWLPTVLGSAKGKMVLNAALGFDTYLVMRHGARTPAPTPEKTSGGANTPERLGCYYCNDIVAPADSLTDRTLDQMCTVTRPGLASIAASTAVELLVSMIQHPAGIHAPPPPATSASSRSDNSNTINADANNGVLGQVPHQLRGFLAQSFRNMPIVGAAYGRCTGCSETVLKEYESKGFDMLLRAFNEMGYLEELTGLADLHKEGEQALEAVDWDEDDGGEGDDF